MNAITQCPICDTRFKVTQAQLDAHQGLVRCGRCQAVFNAATQLHDDQPSPQLDLPIAPQEAPQALVETASEAEAEFVFATDEEFDLSRADASPVETETETESSSEEIKLESAEPLTLAQKIAFVPGLDAAPAAPPRKKRIWPWAVGCLLLSVMLLAQAAYFFRIELAARLPGLRPALMSYCALLGCTVPLPQQADLMSIESSDLEVANPTLANVITLNAILRNRAPYAQAYPSLELTLTDTEERAVARRTFRPAEYLKPGEDENQGLAANRELNVKLNLDTTDLAASGYRLFLFYPQH